MDRFSGPPQATEFREKMHEDMGDNLANIETIPSGRLKLRKAEQRDRPDLLELTRLWHEESALSDIPFSMKKAQASADKAIGPDPAYFAAVVEQDNRIVGGLYAFAGEYYLGETDLVTTVHGFFVHPELRKSILSGKVALKLFRAARQWSDHIGSKYMMFHVTSGINPAQTDRFMRKLGMKTLGGNYVG